MKINCLIVDDEPLAHKVIQNYILRLDHLELAGQCYHAVEAINFLHEKSVDLLFLDIQMPEVSGLEMLQTLTQAPQVILTSAYSNFALESYEYGVVDYLLKPIAFPRFLKAINRVKANLIDAKPISTYAESALDSKSDFVFLKENQSTHKVFFSDILFVQAYGNYLKVFGRNQMMLVAETMKQMESLLPASSFLRIHRSYLVHLQHIDRIEGNQVILGEHRLPVGAKYKRDLEKKLSI